MDNEDDVWYQVVHDMAKDPAGIFFNNINDENLIFWIDKSLQYELYELTSILKQEQEKRNGKI